MQDRSDILAAYNAQAGKLAAQYSSVKTTDVLPGITSHLPRLRALDAGCGNGRDAKWLAEQGYEVDAFDGATDFLAHAISDNSHPHVTHYHDTLPEMTKTRARGRKYDFILLSAVWMHIHPSRRAETLSNLAEMANPGAIFLISLRHGESPKDRKMFEVSVEEMRHLAALNFINTEVLEENSDKLGRSNVWWDTVYLHVPRQHEDQLRLIRQSAIEAPMTPPHKPVLMWSLARAAEAITPHDAAYSHIPLVALAPVWNAVYAPGANLRFNNRAMVAGSLREALRDGPARHMKDPQTGSPLFAMTHQGLLMPRSLGEAISAHAELIEAGSTAATLRFLDKRRATTPELRQHFSTVMSCAAA